MAPPPPTVAACSLALAVALLLAGCSSSTDDSGGDGGTGGTGSASAYVKDKPSDDFREVHVLVTETSVHRSGGSVANGTSTAVGTATGTTTSVANTTLSASFSATATAASSNTTGSGSEAGWVVVFSDPAGVDVDLLDTTGARAAFLGESDLAAGRYQQVRMTIKEAWGITQDGDRENITVSGGTLKSVRSFEVESGKETRITIDIDLEKSLHRTGNGQWRMTPVVGKTTAAVVDDDSSGEDTAQPGDVESVPEAGSGSTGGVSASGSAGVTTTSTGTSSSGTTTS